MKRHVEAQRLGGLEIDAQLVLCRLLHRQIGKLGALEDAVNVLRRLAKLFGVIGTIIDQTTLFREKTIEIDRRHAIAGRQCNDQVTICDVK